MILHHTDWPRNPESALQTGKTEGGSFSFSFFQGGFGQELQRLEKGIPKQNKKPKKKKKGEREEGKKKKKKKKKDL
jgi:hypothetical protein